MKTSDTCHGIAELKNKMSHRFTMNLLLILVASVSMILPAMASESIIEDSTSFVVADQVITMHDRMENPNDYPVNATIEFVFENIHGDNHWDTKEYSGDADAKSDYVAHQAYFIQNTGRFNIHMIHKINGESISSQYTEFIVFGENCKAVLNGCGSDHEIVIKPDYSTAMCAFDKSVEKFAQRGWVVD